MAEAVDTGLLPRTYFKAPRVPFDFRALALAILGYLVFWAGGLLLNEIFRPKDWGTGLGDFNVTGAFLAAAFGLFRDVPFIGDVIGWFLGEVFRVQNINGFPLADYSFWHKLIGGVWFFLVWSYFGQAIHRITSLRIARDEGLSFVETLKFSWGNWLTVLLCPVVVVGAMAFFYGCNVLAGLVIAIPFVGQVLSLILTPLAVLATLLLLLIGLGGVFGLPLVGAAAAWERNGTLDAISRAFSYIFARPLQFFWNYFLIFLFVGIILLVGRWFTYTLTKSVDSGIWDSRLTLIVDPPMATGVGVTDSDYARMDKDLQEAHDRLRKATDYRPGTADAPDAQPFAKDFAAVGESGIRHGLNAIIFWVFLNLIALGVFGYAVYWFLGASTCVYADLRADVDGTEEDVIYLEEEEDDFDALAEVAAGAAPEGEAPAPGPDSDQPPPQETPPSPEGDSGPAEGGSEGVPPTPSA